MLQIDGSYGEGGGQIIRTSLSLSVLTGRPVEIYNVRAGRKKPGLQPQHLASVRAAGALCNAEIEGAAVGSVRFLFTPGGPPRPQQYRFDIGTAGATPLVAQTVLVPLALAGGGSHVTITGGTHVPHAPSAEYVEAVYVPVLQRAGLDVAFSYPAAGFYPRGGGQVELEVRAPALPTSLDLSDRGKLRSLRAFIITSNLPEHVAERGAAAVEKFMKAVGRGVTVERREKPSPSTGAAVVLVAECENGTGAFTGIGERGRPMEQVAEAPCEEFMRWWKTGAACDGHLSDQLVLPMALAAGESRWSAPVVTEHLRTVLWVAAQFLPVEHRLEERADGSALVVLRGAGGSDLRAMAGSVG
ncbi:MAG TPA: RNA 3'-terminal phosphate cyclase [Armatimonadota bacterium]|nr:RNA 3'-terminal phosphate cyclase [Armatimonadota bacterium]